jgi:hypothetical protein
MSQAGSTMSQLDLNGSGKAAVFQVGGTFM